MTTVDLKPVETAVVALKTKYPNFTFEMHFEPTVSGTRGIVEVRVNPANKPEDAASLSMIVPNNMTSDREYQQRIEEFFGQRFGLRD
jgi:hypothetical protein